MIWIPHTVKVKHFFKYTEKAQTFPGAKVNFYDTFLGTAAILRKKNDIEGKLMPHEAQNTKIMTIREKLSDNSHKKFKF